jgi:hypothetical protein
MSRACRGCGHSVPDLPWITGAGDYCAATCRWLHEFTEAFVPFELPGDRPCEEATCGRIIRADGHELAIKDRKGRLMCAAHHITSEFALIA